MNEDFTSGGSWTALGVGIITYPSGEMRVATPTGKGFLSGNIGASKSFTTDSGQQTVSYGITLNTCEIIGLPPATSTPRPIYVYIRNSVGTIIAGDTQSVSGTYSFTFHATSSGTYHIEYYIPGTQICYFNVDNVIISYDETESQTVCDTITADYRYGFQRQEKDDEIKGTGNSINYKYRMHDPRIGRFFAIDPLAPKYSYNSPYAFSENRVIEGIELEGLEVFFSAKGAYLGMLGDSREIRVIDSKNVEEAKNYIAMAKDPSENGLKNQAYNTKQVTSLGKLFHDASEEAQAAVSKKIFEVWIGGKVNKMNVNSSSDGTIGSSSGDGEYTVFPKATGEKDNGEEEYINDNLYNQVNLWSHEKSHDSGLSGDAWQHTQVDINQMSHWSFQYITQGYRNHRIGHLESLLNKQHNQLVNTMLRSNTPSGRNEIFNSKEFQYYMNVHNNFVKQINNLLGTKYGELNKENFKSYLEEKQ